MIVASRPWWACHGRVGCGYSKEVIKRHIIFSENSLSRTHLGPLPGPTIMEPMHIPVPHLQNHLWAEHRPHCPRVSHSKTSAPPSLQSPSSPKSNPQRPLTTQHSIPSPTGDPHASSKESNHASRTVVRHDAATLAMCLPYLRNPQRSSFWSRAHP